MSSLQTHTHEIKISVETLYLEQHSEPENNRFAFSYTITINNEGTHAAQLISRHWIITDANNAVQEVKGMGVIGEQPRILPGESYTYSSGSILQTQAGTMEGSYQMKTDDGEEFDVAIPTFMLTTPRSLH